MFSFTNKLYNILPIITSILLILAFDFNGGRFFDYRFAPSVSAICVFFWAFMFYNFFGAFTVFLIGLVSDIILQNPMGLECFSLLITYLITINQREMVMRYGFAVFWGYFAYFCLIFFVIKYIVLTIYFMDFDFHYTYITQFLYTILAYPIIHWLLSYINLKKLVAIKI